MDSERLTLWTSPTQLLPVDARGWLGLDVTSCSTQKHPVATATLRKAPPGAEPGPLGTGADTAAFVEEAAVHLSVLARSALPSPRGKVAAETAWESKVEHCCAVPEALQSTEG